MILSMAEIHKSEGACKSQSGNVTKLKFSDAIAAAQNSMERRCYLEASDMLAQSALLDCDDLELEIRHIILELHCQMALSNLGQAKAAWDDLEAIIKKNSKFNSSEISLLGTRLFWARGDVRLAIKYAKDAVGLARNSKDRILSQTSLSRVSYALSGDAAAMIKELSSYWTALRADANFSEEARSVMDFLRLTLATASLAQGKLHLARDIVAPVDQARTVIDLEMQLVFGIIHMLSGNQHLAIQAAQNIDIDTLSDGSSRQEQGIALWHQVWIFHAAGHEREAHQKAEDLFELIASCTQSGFQTHGDLLLASCLIQRKNFKKASILLNKYSSSAASGAKDCVPTNEQLSAILILCEALLIYEKSGLHKLRRHLLNHEQRLFTGSALLTISLMCHAHEQMLALLCKSFGVEHLPNELTDLLDTLDFQVKYRSTLRQLTQGESAKLQSRFVRCTKESEHLVLREKPLQICLFGGLNIKVGNNELDLHKWGSSRTRSLLIILSLGVGNEFAREMLIERLWPNDLSDDICSRYNVTWCQMRRKIISALPINVDGESELIYDAFQNSGGRCILSEKNAYVDVREFKQLSSELSDYLHISNQQGCLSTIKKMNEIYKGDLLPGDRYLDWLELERNHYRKQFIDAMLLGAGISLSNNEPEAALFYLHRLDTLEPENEEQHYLSMRAYASTGRREEAISIYHNCRRYLREELGLDPSPRLTNLHQELLCAGA